jgi:hypothetical protein
MDSRTTRLRIPRGSPRYCENENAFDSKNMICLLPNKQGTSAALPSLLYHKIYRLPIAYRPSSDLADQETVRKRSPGEVGSSRGQSSCIPPVCLLPGFASSSLTSPFKSQLDPFFRLPCEITLREKNLVHLYLTSTPKSVYGTNNKAYFCPVRDISAIHAQADEITLQWMIWATDHSLTQAKASVHGEPHILSRKAYIYNLMNRAITDKNTCYTDNTLTAIAVAGIMEARMGDTSLGRKHLSALRILIARRGGPSILQNMLFGQAMIISASYISIGTGEATFRNSSHLETTIKKFVCNFKAMQAWNQNLRITFEDCKSNDVKADVYEASLKTLPSISSISSSSQLGRSAKYRSSRRKVFGPHSVLRKYLELIALHSSADERRCFFAVLWNINNMLYDLQKDYDESRTFFEHLLSDVTLCEIPAVDRSAQTVYLKSPTLIYILASVTAKHSSGNGERGGVLHTWNSINILELIELATKDSREEISSLLSSWLTNDELDIFYVTDRRLDEICKEIRTEWLRRTKPD